MNIYTVQEANPIDDTPFIGIFYNVNNGYCALTLTRGKRYKTLAGAIKFMKKMGYNISL